MAIKPTRKQHAIPPPNVIAVDVDGTLIVQGRVNNTLVSWCKRKKNEGFTLILWSMRGANHAQQAAELSGLTDCFDSIISKPGFVVDDKGWSWIQDTVVVSSIENG